MVLLAFFPEVIDLGLTSQHSFVTYGPSHNQSLGFHADDSEVTFNFRLGGDFIGSDLISRSALFWAYANISHVRRTHRD